MHKLCNVRKTCLPEAVYLVDFEDRELRVSEFNIHLINERRFLSSSEVGLLALREAGNPEFVSGEFRRHFPRLPFGG